jgi:iron complex outermembrane receptor protein
MSFKFQTRRAALYAQASILALGTMGLSQVAWAQDADTQASEEDVIVVTMERREQTLQNFAGTGAVLTGEDLDQLGLKNLDDIDSQIPGLQIANNQGNLEVYIRGVGSSNNTELGDPAAATHLDGVYLPRPAGIGAGFFDIERVEVNVGPQGTLRGRNATAGTINIIPWKPWIGNFDAMGEVGVGNFGELTLEGMVNIPLGDTAALRIAGIHSEHDSYLKNVTPCSSELMGVDVPSCEDEGVGVAEAANDLGLRASLAWQPSDKLYMMLSGDYLQQRGTGYTGVNFANALGNGINPDDIDEPREVIGRAFTPDEDTEHYGGRLFASYDIGNGLSVEYTGGLRDLVYDYEFVTPASVNYDGVLDTLGPLDIDNFSRVRFITDSESTTHEFRLVSDDSRRLFGSVGAFIFDEDQRTFLGTTGDRNPFFTGVEFNQSTKTDSYSLFGDATYKVTDKFSVTAGLRYTDDEKERFGVNARYQFIIGGAGFSCCFGTGVGTEGFNFAALDRTIFNPDTNNDGAVSEDETLAFYFDGVETFGARDGLDDIFANGVILGDAPPEARPFCNQFAFTDPNGCFGPQFYTDLGLDGRVAFAVLGGNSIALQNGSLDNDFVDWRLRAQYDLDEDHMAYALISTGHKSGGFNDNVPGTEGLGIASPAGSAPTLFDVDTFAPTYDEEKLTLFEVGTKNSFDLSDDVSGTFNLSAFYYDYDDKQEFTLLSTTQIIDFNGIELTEEQRNQLGGNVVAFNFNAADAEIYGAQVEGSLELPDDLTLRGTFLWLPTAKITDSIPVQDSRFQADVDPVNSVAQDISGNRLVRTPKVQINASVGKAWDVGANGQFDAILSAGYRSSQNLTIFNGIDYNPNDDVSDRLLDDVDGYWTFDAGAGYTFDSEGKYRLEGYVSNITDQQPEEAIIITQFDNTRFFRRPRTYGLRLRAKY